MMQHTLVIIREHWIKYATQLVVRDRQLIIDYGGSNRRFLDIKAVIVGVSNDHELVKFPNNLGFLVSIQVVWPHNLNRHELALEPLIVQLCDLEVAPSHIKEKLVELIKDMIHILVDIVVVSFSKVRLRAGDTANVDYCAIFLPWNGHSVLTDRQVNIEVALKDELHL